MDWSFDALMYSIYVFERARSFLLSIGVSYTGKVEAFLSPYGWDDPMQKRESR